MFFDDDDLDYDRHLDVMDDLDTDFEDDFDDDYDDDFDDGDFAQEPTVLTDTTSHPVAQQLLTAQASGVAREGDVAEPLPDTEAPGVVGAWNRIVVRAMAATQLEDERDQAGSGIMLRFFGEPSDLRSIMDEIQMQYRAERITEAERDHMREQVKELVGDRDTYACGLWAPSAAPMGALEHGLILMTLQLLAMNAAGEL
jgi:hypothetical protein